MNRIDLDLWIDGSKSAQVYNWFRENFGEPYVWEGQVTEPIQLKSKFKWAYGNRFGLVCIWCPDNIYSWFLLRWL